MTAAVVLLALTLAASTAAAAVLYERLRTARDVTAQARAELDGARAFMDDAHAVVAARHGEHLGDLVAAWRVPSVRHAYTEEHAP